VPRPDACRKSFHAWLADVAPREVVRGGLDRGDAATCVGKEYSWMAKRILPD
jgi:hypothetical protein